MTNSNKKFDTLEVTGLFLKESPTGKAFWLAIVDKDGRELLRKWLPHSQVKTSEGERVAGEYRETVVVSVPMWLADNEGISDLFHDELMDKEYGQLDEYEEMMEEEVTDEDNSERPWGA